VKLIVYKNKRGNSYTEPAPQTANRRGSREVVKYILCHMQIADTAARSVGDSRPSGLLLFLYI